MHVKGPKWTSRFERFLKPSTSSLVSIAALLDQIRLYGESEELVDEVIRLIERAGVSYEVDARMVRGLDYYTRTIFEIQGDAGSLGAQATLVGGGRYNELVGEFGGKPTPSIGTPASTSW